MKNTKLYIGLLALVMFAFLSCEQMNDYHYDYIKDGEIRYTTKLDSVQTFAGYNRVKILGVLNQPYGVEQIRVYYNNMNDSFLVDYIQENDFDTVSIMLNDLAEKSYSFDIYTNDSEGNRSVKVTTFATVYGDLYRSNLLGRAIDSDSARGDIVYIHWLPSDEMERGAEITYKNTSGEDVTLTVSSDSSFTILNDFAEGIKYRSLYVPEVTAIDSFASDWYEQELQIFGSTGTFIHPLLGSRDFALDKVLRSVTENTYETDFADLGGPTLYYRMKLKVDSENNVELFSVGSTPTIISNGINIFDPATETFTLNYKYDHLTGERVISEVLVRN